VLAYPERVEDDRINWGLGAALVGVVLLAIALMLGFGFALDWATQSVAG
jgi:hypothetical protein